MRSPSRIHCVVLAIVVLLSASRACADCPSVPAWLPNTPAPTYDKPLPHPEPDCGFYKPAWQTFLFATQPDTDGRAAFLSYPTISDVFGRKFAVKFAPQRGKMLSLAPRSLKGSNDPSTDPAGKAAVVNAGARQAGLNGLLVDQRGNPVFYAIHMNQTFADFVGRNGLTTKAALQAADANLPLEKGGLELKSAWQIVPAGSSGDGFITTQALVPVLKQVGSSIDVDESAPPREVTVALLAIHVVFALEGHPEMIWATFEHVDEAGVGDLAPAGPFPDGSTNNAPVNPNNFILYKGGTSTPPANQLPGDADLVAAFDSVTQSFTKGGTFQTSIFRLFPTSKQQNVPEDDDVVSLNGHMRDDFAKRGPDKRSRYRLVGAIWLDHPETTFLLGKPLANPPGVGPDSDGAIVVGEDGLSSMAMESFTQDTFVNCFSCHDARRVTDTQGNVLMTAKKLNVSHIFSRFVSDTP